MGAQIKAPEIRFRLTLPFLKFGGLSGLGWIVDFCIFLALVRFVSASTFFANAASSSIAALSVFLLSRRLIFNKVEGGFFIRVSLYVSYVVAVILIASLSVQFITPILGLILETYAWHPGETMVAGMAKIVITPPQLGLNFLIARMLSEKKLRKTRQ
jgi:putative flippase GtrA